MAGILFTDGKFTLAGVNRESEITGIGGKKKGEETPIQTAIRETVEELFEPEEIPVGLFEELYTKLIFDNMMFKSNYSTFIMNFDDIKVFFLYAREYNLKSKVYEILPLTIQELILERKVVKNIELRYMMLIPNRPLHTELDFDGCFVNDIIHLNLAE
jgi:hypothetical protein